MSFTGLTGDIHLDLTALDATIGGPLRECDALLTTGDFLDRGPAAPREVIARLLELDVQLLVGNHELVYLGGPAYRGMREPAGMEAAPLLRDLVLDGRLRAAAAIEGVLCVHGGVSYAFWRQHLADECGTNVAAIALTLNRWLLRGVLRRDFSHPVFAALDARVRGPFWAHAIDDVVAPGCPPFPQAVGHTKVALRDWHESGDGSLFPLEWAARRPGDVLGHLLLAAAERELAH